MKPTSIDQCPHVLDNQS